MQKLLFFQQEGHIHPSVVPESTIWQMLPQQKANVIKFNELQETTFGDAILNRPDLSSVSPEVIEYIEYLEARLKVRIGESARVRETASSEDELPRQDIPLPGEMPSARQILTASQAGSAKRTPRHLYTRQHRGGMGVFDLDLPAGDQPLALTGAESTQGLLLFTDRARVFRMPMERLNEEAVRAKGEFLLDRLPLEENEHLQVILPEQASGYVTMVSAAGKVRTLRHHLFGEHMRPGTAMFNVREFGPLAAACWTAGDRDLLVVTRGGMGIRFNEKLISPAGDIAIRLAPGDEIAAITPVDDDSKVFLLGADGRGTVRLMSAFAANKSMGGSGKMVMKCARLVTAFTIDDNDDVFIISRLSKVIRFPVAEVPTTESTIQGVVCMSLRADEVCAALPSPMP